MTKAAGYRGGNTFASSLRTIKAQAVEMLSDDERAALKPILDAQPARRSPRELLAARSRSRSGRSPSWCPSWSRADGRRDFERGRRLYGAVACAACHRFGHEGGGVGPDLTGVAGRFSVRDLLESIVEPSKVISDQYAAVSIADEGREGRDRPGRESLRRLAERDRGHVRPGPGDQREALGHRGDEGVPSLRCPPGCSTA